MGGVNGSRIAWMFRPRAVLVGFAVLVAAALLVLWSRPHAATGGMQAVVAASAALDYRPSIARLSADFPYHDVNSRLRGRDDADISAASASLWGLIERLRQDGGERHALGVSYLLVGKPKDAVATLEQTLRSATNQHGELSEAIRRSDDAALLNDLTVSYLAVDDPALQPLALECVERAWAIERTPAVAWTRAVVSDAYRIRERSIATWRDFLALESRSRWSDFARRQLSELLQPTDAELWPAARARLGAARNDDPSLLRDVDRFRQDVRLWCEDELLPDWGDAVLRGDPSAASRLAKIEALGEALEEASGERGVAETVAAIRIADGGVLRQLAKGHVAYGAGLQAEKQSTIENAINEMARAAAALDSHTTPFAWRARMEHAGMLYSANQYQQALAELQQLERDCGTRLSIAGQGRLQTLLAVTFTNIASYKEAADHFARAVEAYRSIGERNYHAALLIRLSQALHRMGRTADAGRHLRQGLEILERTGDSKQRHYGLIVAAFQALETGQQAQAGLFFDALVEIDAAAGDASRTCTSAMWRSAYRYRLGLSEPARTDLAVALHACGSITDSTVRERQLAFLEVAKAVGADATMEPLIGLDDSIRYFDRVNNRIWLSTAYFARARRLARRGAAEAAERDFQRALRETDANREKIDERLLRVSFTATADEIADGYVEFLLQQRRERDAFETSDRRRVRELVDSSRAHWRDMGPEELLPDLQSALPANTALVEYRILRDRIVAWVVARGRLETVVLPSPLGDVITAVDDVQSNASFLYDALLRPLELTLGDVKVLVIVPDDKLERVAFSALHDGVRGRSLLHACATVITPSAALFVRSRARSTERFTRHEQVVVVNAAAGGAGVAALPRAVEEAESIAALYRGARIVDGSTVTGTSLLREFEEATVLQFVGHTAMDADPSSRTLRLGESPQARLRMEDIAGAAMPKMRLVYLSACETDSGPVLKSEGSITIARSFFAAGVPLVVGTLWPIDDDAARLAARTFHDRLLRGDTPAESLRQAQLALQRDGIPFRDWASLRLIGAGF